MRVMQEDIAAINGEEPALRHADNELPAAVVPAAPPIEAVAAAPLSICVYGSSSKTTRPDYLEASREMGRLLAAGGHTCINGGGKTGCMGALNEGCLGNGGSVVAVMHRMWMDEEGSANATSSLGISDMRSDDATLEILIADGPTLTERKDMLATPADCFIAMPGGPGTFEELWEMVCQRQLGLPAPAVEGGPRGRGPVVMVNTDGYYDGFMEVVRRASTDGLLHWQSGSGGGVAELIAAVATPEEALEYCIAAVAEERALGGSGAAASAAAEDDSPVAASSSALALLAEGSSHTVMSGGGGFHLSVLCIKMKILR